MKLIGPVLLLAASAWGEAPRVPLLKGFTPNPMLVPVQRVEGGAAALEPGFASCKDVAPGAQVSRSPVAVLDLGEGITHLTLQASQNDRVIARGADGVTSCGDKLLTLEVKPGPLEVFVVTAAAVEGGAAGKLRVFDADRPRILPDAVKTVSVDGRSPVVLSGEVTAAASNIPNAQLDVTAKLEHLEWKLDGAAGEVWLSPLSLEDAPPVKAGDALAQGRYAVWIRGAKPGSFTVTATAVAPAPVEAAGAAAPSNDPLRFSSKPAADAALEARVLTAFMPSLDVKLLEGFSRDAVALRKRAFTELPAEFFVFASADGEVLLPLQYDGAELSVIAADGATFSMPVAELALKPANGAPLVRPQRPELVAKLGLAELATDKDPRVKSLEKLKKQIQSCIDRHPEWPDAAKRCNASKVDKARSKLEATLKKAYAKQRAAELAAIAKRVKAVVAARAE